MSHDCQRPNTPEEDIWIDLQMLEDTCSEHGVFCCPQCFDVSEKEGV